LCTGQSGDRQNYKKKGVTAEIESSSEDELYILKPVLRPSVRPDGDITGRRRSAQQDDRGERHGIDDGRKKHECARRVASSMCEAGEGQRDEYAGSVKGNEEERRARKPDSTDPCEN